MINFVTIKIFHNISIQSTRELECLLFPLVIEMVSPIVSTDMYSLGVIDEESMELLNDT